MTQTYASAVKAYSEEMSLGVWPRPFEVWLEEMKQKGQYWETGAGSYRMPVRVQTNDEGWDG